MSRTPIPFENGDDPVLTAVAEILDPVLAPLGFAAAQGGAAGADGQVIFCRGYVNSADDGCVDLVVDLNATPNWHIVAVRYWGFTSDRWQLDVPRDGSLVDQLSRLAETLPLQLG